MKRRDAIKNISLFTGGLLLFSSCDFSDKKVTIILNKLQINAKEETLLKQVVGTILPEGKIPGGVSLKAHNFVWVIIDECTSEEKQDSFMKGFRMFNQQVLDISSKNFTQLNEEKKLVILQNFMNNKNTNPDILNFLNSTKQIAVWGYMNSEYIMTEQMPYKLVPGAFSYEPCKSINNTEKININA